MCVCARARYGTIVWSREVVQRLVTASLQVVSEWCRMFQSSGYVIDNGNRLQRYHGSQNCKATTRAT